jgi:hypothetical protein
VAPAEPELADGADDEPNEPELDDEPELVPLPEDPVLEDPVPEEPVPEEPVPELDECPVLAEFDDPVLLAVLCAAAGSSTITTPATAAPTIPAPMVALRSRRRAWSRAKMAETVRSSLFILGAPLSRAVPHQCRGRRSDRAAQFLWGGSEFPGLSSWPAGADSTASPAAQAALCRGRRRRHA